MLSVYEEVRLAFCIERQPLLDHSTQSRTPRSPSGKGGHVAVSLKGESPKCRTWRQLPTWRASRETQRHISGSPKLISKLRASQRGQMSTRFQLLVSFIVPGVLLLTAVCIPLGILLQAKAPRVISGILSSEGAALLAVPGLAISYIFGLVSYAVGHDLVKRAYNQRLDALTHRLICETCDRHLPRKLARYGAPATVVSSARDMVEAGRAHSPREPRSRASEVVHFMRSAVLMGGTDMVADQLEYSWQLMRTLRSLRVPLVAMGASLLLLTWYTNEHSEEHIVAMVAVAFADFSVLTLHATELSLRRRSESQTRDVVRFFLALRP